VPSPRFSCSQLVVGNLAIFQLAAIFRTLLGGLADYSAAILHDWLAETTLRNPANISTSGARLRLMGQLNARSYAWRAEFFAKVPGSESPARMLLRSGTAVSRGEHTRRQFWGALPI